MLDDYLLWWRSKHGSRRAFDAIYQRHVDRMLSVALHLLGNAADAQDVVQEVFASLVETPETIELRGSLKGFLAICVANKSRDLLRRRRLAPAGHADPTPAGGCEPLELVIHSEQILRLREALRRLPYEQQEIITLHIHAGLTFRAVARALRLPLGTVQSRYRYGLNSLKMELEREDSL
ncbi:MAG: RNA polymerase sigma factor [Phycisphaerales bacterium]